MTDKAPIVNDLRRNPASPPPTRRLFCNRTLNMRSIKAVGFDMDYTLIHYHVQKWEHRAYGYLQKSLEDRGWPVRQLRFDPDRVALGLILDLELGNIVKANRFGYIKRASHGTRMLDFEDQRAAYARVVVDLSESRWVFLNTLFGLSEACMYGQLVDLLDAGKLGGAIGYADLYRAVRSSLDEAHMEGALKAEIVEAADTFVDLDPDLPLALLDLKHADKKLLLITNSEWAYTQAMMCYAFDRFLPESMSWRDLFNIVIVAARKPAFFSQKSPIFEVINDQGHLRPVVGKLTDGGIYLGGHAGLVESHLRLSGEQILYVGDHIFADMNVSKSVLRWRTALVVRQLEEELEALAAFKDDRQALHTLMMQKEDLEQRTAELRVQLLRLEGHYGPRPTLSSSEIKSKLSTLRAELVALDEHIAPLAQASAEMNGSRWGLLMRAGNDKSHLARQVERYADVYTSRVSNLLTATPFVYLRSPRGSLPHDSAPG